MEKVRLGRTNLMVSRSGFGCIPIQRLSQAESRRLLRKAFAAGINFFDTARAYSDSEEKIGLALSDERPNIIIATKSKAKDGKNLRNDLEKSLKLLKTDYVDLLQLHNPDPLPDPLDPDGAYNGLLEAQKDGLVRFIGITNHKVNLAMEAARSGLYDTVQYPLSTISTEEELKLIPLCQEHDLGLIAMKALSGGLITKAVSAFAFLRQYSHVVPIWGIEEEWQLDEFISFEENPPSLDAEITEIIEKDRKELSGSFCRGCAYCMPCPVGIPIPTAARVTYLIARHGTHSLLSPQWREKMDLIDECIECHQCKDHCPYELDTPELLKKMLRGYRAICEEEQGKA
jgi:uncharacterized protein